MATMTERIEEAAGTLTTTVRALFLHGPRGAHEGDAAPTPMIAADVVEAVTGKGLRGDSRYFSATRRNGSENLRQVSLIDEGTLARHAAQFGPFAWEHVKSQIFLAGDLRLSDLLGKEIMFGEDEEAAVLQFTIKRDPCYAMDLIAPGLREAMKDGEQGAMARVLRGGTIRIGQKVSIRL